MRLAGTMAAVDFTAAYSTEDFCAVVLKTPDGFLALREKPGTQFKMIAKLHEGDIWTLIRRNVPVQTINIMTIPSNTGVSFQETPSAYALGVVDFRIQTRRQGCRGMGVPPVCHTREFPLRVIMQHQ